MSAPFLSESAGSAWLEMRTKLLTGTDAAKIMGMDPWGGTGASVWAEKTGKVERDRTMSEKEAVRWGVLLEPAVRDEVLLRYGRDTLPVESWNSALPSARVFTLDHFCDVRRRPEKRHMLQSVDHEFLGYTPDGIHGEWTAFPGAGEFTELSGRGIQEIKCTSGRLKNGPNGERRSWDDDPSLPPLEYQPQPFHGMLTGGLEWASMYALIAGQRLRAFDIELTATVRDFMLNTLGEFWDEYVLRDIMPEDADGATLKAVFARETVGKIVELPAEDFSDMDDRRAFLKARMKSDKAEVEMYDNALRRAAEDAEVCEIPKPDGGVVQYKLKLNRAGHRPITRKVIPVE